MQPSLFFEPKRYRPHGIGYWSGHIPFACDLIYSLEPKVLVELGSHYGESYFAFCQAVKESGSSTQTFAVDTWRGDHHTGAYSDAVFAEVTEENKQYQSFSRLLRMTFAEALPNFDDDSIDVLHIDGSHVYDDVRRDFTDWWPKVRPGGVVLFHDSFERQHNFGVWRLLEELRKQWPGNEFVHSHGLGVIVKPPASAGELLSWSFAQADETRTREMRRYYEICAGAMRSRYLTERRAPSDWDVVSQLLWQRGGATEYSETESVRASELVGQGGTAVLLPVPPSVEPYRRFRVKLTLEPALLAFDGLYILDEQNRELYRAGAKGSGAEGHLLRQDAVLAGDVERSQFELQIPDRVRVELSKGGALYLQLRGLDPTKISGELVSQPRGLARLLGRS